MKKAFLFGLFFSCAFLSRLEAQHSVYDQVEALAKKFPEHTEVSIGITDHGKRFFVGFKKTKGRLILVNNRGQVFGIASLTKLFTSILVAALVTENKLALQDEIGQFYSFKIRYANHTSPITIKSLCTHTSGLPTDGGLSFLKSKIDLGYDEGKYRYSNLGFIILGDIVEKVSGKKYAELLEEKILKPLRLKSTSIDLENIEAKKIVKGRNASGHSLPVQTAYAYEGVGSLKSSAIDLLVFIEHHYAKRSPLKASLKLVQQPAFRKSKTEAMGMGWHILYKGNKAIYSHSGYLQGYTAEIKMMPEQKRGVVVLSNLSGSGPHAGEIEKIAFLCL